MFRISVLIRHDESKAVLRFWLQVLIPLIASSNIDSFTIPGTDFNLVQNPGVTEIVTQMTGDFIVVLDVERYRSFLVKILHYCRKSVRFQSRV